MYRCSESGCEEKFDDDKTLTVHLSYHVYFQKIKDLGKKELELMEERFNLKIDCPLVDHLEGSDYFPQMPKQLICDWYDCNEEFLCVETFYNHVANHAHRLVDKCYWSGCTTIMKKMTLQLLREHLRVHTLQKLYACPYCGNFFSTKIKFADHFMRHLPVDKFLQGKERPSKLISSKRNGELKLDVEEYTVKDGKINIFRCGYDNCDKAFFTSSLLREHIRVHSTKNQCDQCAYVAISKSQLDNHKLYRHNDERKHPCSICKKTFKQKNDLRVHLRRHQIVEPYRCDECGFESVSAEGLNTHAQTHYTDLYYCCHLCYKIFNRGNNLSRHLKYKHDLKPPAGQLKFRYKLNERKGAYYLDIGRGSGGDGSGTSTNTNDRNLSEPPQNYSNNDTQSTAKENSSSSSS